MINYRDATIAAQPAQFSKGTGLVSFPQRLPLGEKCTLAPIDKILAL